MADISIKDAPLINNVSGAEKIPVSDGSGEPKAVTIDLITLKIPAAGAELGIVKTGGDVTITDGVITVNGKAPTSHASTATTYGLGTTSNYGHVKISNSDVDTVSTSNGVAAGMDHTHSKLAPKASPTFTGTPTAPTAAVGTNTTQLATTAFVNTTVNTEFSNRLPNISKEEFDKLINRDFYCPLVNEIPGEYTFTYTDVDGKEREYVIGLECYITDGASEYTFYKLVGIQNGQALWREEQKTIINVDTAVYTDLSIQDIYGVPTARTTANCYVVKEVGDYMFPCAYGAAIKDGEINTAAYTRNSGENSMDFVNYLDKIITNPYVERDTEESIVKAEVVQCDAPNLISNLTVKVVHDEKYIAFHLNSVPVTGANAVISAMDKDYNIMWSWHIWVWKDSLAVETITNETSLDYDILPVNLGSTWDTSSAEPTKIKNWYYQWGRPTPIIGPSAYNSTTTATNYGTRDFNTFGVAPTYGYGIKNPNTFFTSNSAPYNWFGTKSFYNLWDAQYTIIGNSDVHVIKTVYDPCPPGFKMPNGNTFTGFSKSNVVGDFNNGWHLKRNADDTTGIFFPASDTRSHSYGSLYYVGSVGYVWSSSANSQYYAYYLLFNSSNVNPQNTNYRANGYSVRPVKDTNRKDDKTLITTIRIDQNIQDPDTMITRVEDFGGIEAIRANSHRYTGLLDEAGVMHLKLLDDSNSSKYLDGTDAPITTVDVFMKLPQFYYKCVEVSTDIFDISVAYGVTPDGDGWKFWDGLDMIGVYKACVVSKIGLMSISGSYSSGNYSQALYKNKVITRGKGYSLIKWKHHCIMALLFYMYYNNTNCLAICGNGLSSSRKTGDTNSLGMSDTTHSNNDPINFWGLENWWGHMFEFIDNVKSIDGVWTVIEDDGSTRTIGTQVNTDSYISKMLFGENIDLMPTAVGSSMTTGFCDYNAFGTGTAILRRSYCQNAKNGGIAYIDTYYNNQSVGETDKGSRIAFRGNYLIIS